MGRRTIWQDVKITLAVGAVLGVGATGWHEYHAEQEGKCVHDIAEMANGVVPPESIAVAMIRKAGICKGVDDHAVGRIQAWFEAEAEKRKPSPAAAYFGRMAVPTQIDTKSQQ